MNFSGYVQMRRGILEHTMSGHLSLHQYAAFLVLLMLADKSTGMGRINAPVLQTYLPDISVKACQRALERLETKGFIFREIRDHSRLVYRYWVDKFRPTAGKYRMSQTFVAEAIEKRNARYIKYVPVVPEGVLETVPEGVLETVPEGVH